MTGERKPVTRVKLTQYNGGDSLPAVHIGVEPDMDVQEAMLIHVQAYQMADTEAVAQMLRAVADTLLADGLLAGELGTVDTGPDEHTGRRPFNPQPARPSDRTDR